MALLVNGFAFNLTLFIVAINQIHRHQIESNFIECMIIYVFRWRKTQKKLWMRKAVTPKARQTMNRKLLGASFQHHRFLFPIFRPLLLLPIAISAIMTSTRWLASIVYLIAPTGVPPILDAPTSLTSTSLMLALADWSALPALVALGQPSLSHRQSILAVTFLDVPLAAFCLTSASGWKYLYLVLSIFNMVREK